MKRKRLLALLLAVMMVVSALPVGVFAEDVPVTTAETEPEEAIALSESSGPDFEAGTGLYWFKYNGLKDGAPIYSYVNLDRSMWDEVGQDICAVFVLWDGETIVEISPDQLTFPAELTWSIVEDYPNAVYMKFDKALEGDITHQKGDEVFTFHLTVEDRSGEDDEEQKPLEAGLYWCWVEEDENENLFANQDDGYENELQALENDMYEMAFFYVDENGTANRIAMEDLTFPDFVDTNQMESGNAYFVRLVFNEPGTGVITCADYPDSTIELTALKRQLGYYDALPAQEQNRLGDVEGVIEGRVGETVTAYLVWDPAETGEVGEVIVGRFHYAGEAYLIKNAEMSKAAEILSENGITLTLNREDGYVQVDAVIQEDSMNLRLNMMFESGYSETMWLSIDPERNSGGGSDEDPESPSFNRGIGLYWFQLEDVSGGKPVYDYSDVDTSMNDELGQDVDVVFVFWDGETAVEIAPEDLDFPSGLKYETSEDYKNAVCLEFDVLLDDVIRYTKGDKTYEFRVMIDFPFAGFYSEPQRTTENLVTTGLTYTGEDEDEQGEPCTVYYILSDGGKIFSHVEVMMGDSEASESEVRVQLADDGTFAVLYIYEDVQFGEKYKVNLEQNGKRVWRRGFSVRDKNGGNEDMSVKIGYYSEPVLDDAYDLDQMLMGYYGENKTAYLVWDPNELGEIEKVTVYFKMSISDAELEGVELEDAEGVLAEHDIVLTPYLDKGYIQVDAGVGIDKNLELTLHFANGNEESAWLNIDNSLTATINSWRRGKENPVVEYEGVDYTFGIGRIEGSGKFDMFSAGGGFGSTTSNKNQRLEETIYLGAMTDFNTDDQAAAPAWVYDCISDVSFTIADYINAHDLSDQKQSNGYISNTYRTPMAEMDMHTAEIRTDKGGFVEALLQVRFTVTFPGEKPVECLVENVVHFAYNLDIYPDLSEIDTAEDLNELLSGKEAFLSWIKEQDAENGTTMYSDYVNNFALNWESTFELELPAVTYEDIIQVSLDDVEFNIQGTEDANGNRTTMPGMLLLDNNHFFLGNIDFVAVKGITQQYAGEIFTCGVLSGNEKATQRDSEVYAVNNCTFTGFDYGVRNTKYGYTCARGNNVFTDCKVGYLIDCAEKNGGNGNSTTSYSRFVNCDIAIQIKGLQGGISPYDYRIYNCDFIDNDIDIDVSQEGRFYFIKSYYGDVSGKNDPVDDAKDVHKRPPRVRSYGIADVVVNPRWRDPVTLDGGNHDKNHLIVDTKHGLVNYMFNDDALEWSFDSSTLNYDLSQQSEGVSLAMTDDKERTIGTWNLAGGGAQAQLLSLFAEAAADTFCPALDIDEQPDGSIEVTVDDSDLFAQRKVTLTIPCDFSLAAVVFEGDPVESFTANGQVTFTVEQGGTYVISEALTEEAIEQSFITGGAPETSEGEDVPEAEVEIGWFDFNAQETEEENSFVQIGTTTHQTIQQVNPDDENLGDEDQVVETEVITVQAIYQAPVTDEKIQITVLLVLYDSNGRMVTMKEQVAHQNEGTRVITVECDSSLIDTAAVTVRAFVISADGNMSPLAPVPFSQTLAIPAK